MELISFFIDRYTVRFPQDKLFFSCSEAHTFERKNLVESKLLPGESDISYDICIAGKGVSTSHKVSPSGLSEIGKDYYERNFKVNGNVHESIIYIRDSENIELVASLFEEWCESFTKKEEKNPVLICSYDPRKHFGLLGFEKNNTSKKNVLDLSSVPQVTDKKVGTGNNLLVYEPKNKWIFVVNVTEDKDVESIRNELNVCSDNIKVLTTMNEEIFRKKEIRYLWIGYCT